MKKITLVAILGLILLILINPSKISIFSNSTNSLNGMKEINTIDIKNLDQYIEYNGQLCLVDDNQLRIFDKEGNEIYKQNIQKDSIKLYNNTFIDVINKNINRCSSINEHGKTQFAIDSLPDTFIYQSINKYIYITVSKNGENEILKILNDEGGVTKRIEIEGRVTNIESINDMILLSYITVGEKIGNKLIIYDQNGNIKQETEFNDIILEIILLNDNIYLLFENKIEILDKNFKKKSEIQVEGIINIEENNESIIIQNSKKEFYIIENEKLKSIKNIKDSTLKLEGVGKSYVLYSDKTIYNDKLKEIKSFDQQIKDVQSIGENSIAIIFKDSIKLYKIQ